jgi:hypothetical protein
MDNGTLSDELIRWALRQLDAMHSPSADAELDRFSSALAGVYWE